MSDDDRDYFPNTQLPYDDDDYERPVKKRELGYIDPANIIPAAPALPRPTSPQLLVPVIPRYKRDVDGNILDDEQLDANIWGLSSRYLQLLNGRDQNRVLSDFEDDQEWMQEVLEAARAEDDEEEEVIDCATKTSIYVNQYSSDVEDFIAKFVKEEHQEEKTLGDVDLEGIAKRIWLIVMTFEPEIHEALLRGDLPVLYRTDQKVRAAIDKIQARAKALPYQPRIYGNFLVKLATGQSPSPEILSQVADLAIDKYLEDDQYAARVDSAIGSSVAWEDTQRGARKYLDPQRTAAVCNLPSLARVAKLGVLCRALQRRCAKVPKAKWQDPIPGSCSELGYSGYAIQRLSQHARHESSNYLMNLFAAICKPYKSPIQIQRSISALLTSFSAPRRGHESWR